jgi:acyl dehydratase
VARAILLAASLALLLAHAARAGEPIHPLQVELALPVSTAPSGKARSLVPIEHEGIATLRTVVRNQRDGETTRVDLKLDYRVPPGTIALDELVERIEVETATAEGDLFQQVAIDAQLITLNPNRARLQYRVTLFHPTEGASYLVRLRLYGNYE